MACCRCNRYSRCQNCSCVKSSRLCCGSLPLRLGNCVNTVRTQPSDSQATTHSLLSPQSHTPPRRSSPSPSTNTLPRTCSSPGFFSSLCFRLLPTALACWLPSTSLRLQLAASLPLVLSYRGSPPWLTHRSPGALVTLLLRLLIPSMLLMMKLCTGNRIFSKFPLAELERPLSRAFASWNRLLGGSSECSTISRLKSWLDTNVIAHYC